MDLDYNDVLTIIGFGKVHYVLVLTTGLMIMTVLVETMGMGIIIVASKCDLELDSFRRSFMMGAAFSGIVLSSYYWGYLCDIRGRRKMLLISTFSANVMSMISVLTPNFWAFVFMRFMTGFFIAGPATICISYLGEFCTHQNRTLAINCMSMFTGFGIIYAPTLGLFILTNPWSLPIYGDFKFTPWRLQLILYFIPGFCAALVLLFLPESPKYLISIGRTAEALFILNWLCEKNTGQSIWESRRIQSIMGVHARLSTMHSNELYSFRLMWQETKPIFQEPHVRNFLTCCMVMFGLFFIANGLGLWYPYIRGVMRQHENEKIASVCKLIGHFYDDDPEEEFCTAHMNPDSIEDSITFGVAFCCMYVVQGFLLNFAGRKWTIRGELITAFLASFSMHFVDNAMGFLSLFCLFLAIPGTLIIVMGSAVMDMMPTTHRGKAVCICLMMGRLGAILGEYMIGDMFYESCLLIFTTILIFLFLGVCLTFLLPLGEETSNVPT